MLRLELSSRARDFLDRLPAKQFRQVASKVFDLMKEPEPTDSLKLSGFPYRRADVGEYRIIYRVEEDTLVVPLIGNRNDDRIYKDFARFMRS